jgi:hypothetical protein
MMNNSLRDATIGQTGLPLYNHMVSWQDMGLKSFSFYELMEHFESRQFLKAIQAVYAYEVELKRSVEELGNWDREFPDWENKELNQLLDQVSASFKSSEFPHTSNCLTRAHAFGNSKCTEHELYIRVVALRETMEDELRGITLLHVPRLRAEYYNKKDAFGERVAIAFSSAESDIEDAGNCYALDLNAACVFHLMRVLERGLRALAADVGLPFKPDSWGGIIDDIEKKVQSLQSKQDKTPNKKARLHFYSQCIPEFRHFKDAWRNYVMHVAEPCDAEKAESVMGHVRDFMQRLSENISEHPPNEV